ncbi:MAG: CocE/NonD family hydrolase [Pseudomonadota bacterium]
MVGTLTVPNEEDEKSLVLILHGMSGNRKGAHIKGTSKALFEYAADIFAKRGVASLSISTGGRGGSEGKFVDMTLERRIREAVKAIEWISKQDWLQIEKISILGHSQGSLVAVSAATRLARSQPIASIILWAPQTNALSTYRRSMGEAVYQKGLNAKPDEVVSWIGATGKLRAFKRDFFRGLSNIDTLSEIEEYKGRLLIVTGSRDRWSTSTNAQAFKHRHNGTNSQIELDVGHRMGAAFGEPAVESVVNETLQWILSD